MKKKFFLGLLLSTIFIMAFSASAWAVDIRVLLSNSNSSLNFSVADGEYTLLDRSTSFPIMNCTAGDEIAVSLQGSAFKVTVSGDDLGSFSGPINLQAADEEAKFSFRSTKYRGSFLISKSSSSMIAVNILDLEKYLYGVVGKEIGYGAPIEALKAQAVCSRSYAYASRNLSSAYDVTATTSSQTYGGYSAELVSGGVNVIEAVDDTEDEVIYYKNPSTKAKTVVSAFYHANAGGYTENVENIWGPAAPVIPFLGVASPEDAASSSYSWQKTITATEMVSLAKSYGGKDIGEFEKLRIYKTNDTGKGTASGRVYKIEIIGTEATVTATRNDIRTALGGLRSTLFDVSTSSGGVAGSVWIKGSVGAAEKNSDMGGLYAMGSDGVARKVNDGNESFYIVTAQGKQQISQAAPAATATGETIIVNGRGYGHGLGMSQAGAIGMAKNGSSYEDILLRYFMNNDEDSNFYLDTL